MKKSLSNLVVEGELLLLSSLFGATALQGSAIQNTRTMAPFYSMLDMAIDILFVCKMSTHGNFFVRRGNGGSHPCIMQDI